MAKSLVGDENDFASEEEDSSRGKYVLSQDILLSSNTDNVIVNPFNKSASVEKEKPAFMFMFNPPTTPFNSPVAASEGGDDIYTRQMQNIEDLSLFKDSDCDEADAYWEENSILDESHLFASSISETRF